MMRSPGAGRQIFDHYAGDPPSRPIVIAGANEDARREMGRVELSKDGTLNLRDARNVDYQLDQNGWRLSNPPEVRRQMDEIDHMGPGMRMPSASNRRPGPDDPNHPDHADYMKIREAVAKDGRWSDEQIDNISAAAFREYKTDPMQKRLDSVETGKTLPNGDVNVFTAYQPWGSGRESFHSHVSAQEAAKQPAEQSFDQAQQITQQQALAQQQEMTRGVNDPSQGGPKMVM